MSCAVPTFRNLLMFCAELATVFDGGETFHDKLRSFFVSVAQASSSVNPNRTEEADPWMYLKISVDTFVTDKNETEFHFSESLNPKGDSRYIYL